MEISSSSLIEKFRNMESHELEKLLDDSLLDGSSLTDEEANIVFQELQRRVRANTDIGSSSDNSAEVFNMHVEHLQTYKQKIPRICKREIELEGGGAMAAFVIIGIFGISISDSGWRWPNLDDPLSWLPLVFGFLAAKSLLWLLCSLSYSSISDDDGEKETLAILKQEVNSDVNNGFHEKITAYIPPGWNDKPTPAELLTEVLLVAPNGNAKLYQPMYKEREREHEIRVVYFNFSEVDEILVKSEPKDLVGIKDTKDMTGNYTAGGFLIGGLSGAVVGAAVGALVEEIVGPKALKLSAKITINFPNGKYCVFTPLDCTFRVNQDNIDNTAALIRRDVVPLIERCINVINRNYSNAKVTQLG